MPITITDPPSGAPVGPGFVISVQSSFIGPLPTTAFWQADIYATAPTEFLEFRSEKATQDLTTTWVFGLQRNGSYSSSPTFSKSFQVTARSLVVRLWQSPSTLLEQTSIPVTLDLQNGLHWWEQAIQPEVTAGGLTEAQAEQLEIASSSVVRPMGTSTNQLQVPLADLVVHPPVGLMLIDPSPITVTGDGILSGDSGLLPSVFGLWWEFTQVPVEVGFELGALVEYELRMLQLVTIHTIDGVDYRTEVVDANYERVVWLWREAKPTRVEFSLLPGVTCAFHYVRWRGLV